MNNQQIIAKVLGGMAVGGKSYPLPLPANLSKWHCYTLDGGHSILCLLSKDLADAFAPQQFVSDYLLPAPVKSVLRGYTIVNDFVVVTLPYSSETGLEIAEEDEEF